MMIKCVTDIILNLFFIKLVCFKATFFHHLSAAQEAVNQQIQEKKNHAFIL